MCIRDSIVGELMKGFVKRRPVSNEFAAALQEADEKRGEELASCLPVSYTHLAGRYHILSLKNKCRQLRQLNPRVRILEPEISADGSKVEFGFLEGITLAERLGRCIRDGRAPVEEIKAALQFLYDVAEDQKMCIRDRYRVERKSFARREPRLPACPGTLEEACLFDFMLTTMTVSPF